MYEDIILIIITRGIRHTYKCLVAFTTFQLITSWDSSIYEFKVLL